MADRAVIVFDLVPAEDVANALKIEQQGYPPDEAASLEALRYRQSQATELFLGAYISGPSSRELVGYICSTLSPSKCLTHESMSSHNRSSSSVCIHSVCVSPTHRRAKIGLNLLREYISRLEIARKDGQPYERVLLITHEGLGPFYEMAGFEWVGKSSVVHGPEAWYEMRKIIDQTTAYVINDTTLVVV